jgi:heme-degrading monooxygenase HmoA
MTSLKTTDIEVLAPVVRLTVTRWTWNGATPTTAEVSYWRTPEDAKAWRKSNASGVDVLHTKLEWCTVA